ncbi:DUF58 domain-containing protein [Methanosphaerula palustris]|uniref:DUF58 domain-containing protein n=1 Tax=Methanosphaerula palustris (strain ATCC BAA-1556 / DSM 19958 / E1-9c) TaxID=521011 RepID=B8GGA5_METPE|nr:DUF58 domain-containing protein [Methanosphaerula palustris]ACL16179.1 conserved hypothetical protein [Methanosphaerula palustris E1-9c]
MQPTRRAWGIIILASALLLCALIFDDRSCLIASSVLGLFLLYRVIVFSRSVTDILSSLNFTRTVDKSVIRQGTMLEVSGTVTLKNHSSCRVEISDIPPKNSQMIKGNTVFTAGGVDRETLMGTYQLSLSSSGFLSFGGIKCRIDDRFFSNIVIMGEKAFQAPELFVQVSPTFALMKGYGFGPRENDHQNSGFKGTGILSFREYRAGDNLRSVDWKLTAKFNKKYIRVHGDTADDTPLIVADRPDEIIPGSDGVRQMLTSAVASAIEHAIQEYGSCSLVVISGPNILNMQNKSRDIRAMEQMVGGFAPFDRLHRLYRSYYAARTLSSLTRTDQSDLSEEVRIYHNRVEGLLRSSTQVAGPTSFEWELNRIVEASRNSRVYYFGFCEGDLSHIWMLLLTTLKFGTRVSLSLPDSPRCRRMTDFLAFDHVTLEMMR